MRLYPTLPYPRILQCEPLQNEAVDHDGAVGGVARVYKDASGLVSKDRMVLADPDHSSGGVDDGSATHEWKFVSLEDDLACRRSQLKERQLYRPVYKHEKQS